MATNTSEQLLNDLKSGVYAPLYFLAGEEPFFIDQVADFIEENALLETERSFNQTVVYGKDIELKSVLESARSFPMMATRQVIVVKEAQDLADLKRKEAQSQLTEYAKNPVETTVLVFCHKHKKIDARTEMYKALKKHAIVLESKKLYDNQLPTWISNYCKSEGCTITGKAAHLLAEYVGNNLSSLAKSIQKILINFPEKNVEITDALVSEYVGISKEFNVFELQSAFARKNALKVYQILDYFAANPKSNPAIPVVSSLFNYFSKILMVHSQRSKNERELATTLKVNPYFVKEYVQASKSFPMSKTLQVIHFIQEADLQLKGVNSNHNDAQVLKELAFKVLS